MSDPSIPAHMSQRSQLDRTHAALGRHVEEEEEWAALEGEALSEAAAWHERRHWYFARRQSHMSHTFPDPPPQHDWLFNIETPGYMEVA